MKISFKNEGKIKKFLDKRMNLQPTDKNYKIH